MLAIKLTQPFFSKMVIDFAEMFAKDNPRFDANKFYDASNYKLPKLGTK